MHGVGRGWEGRGGGVRISRELGTDFPPVTAPGERVSIWHITTVG